MIVAPTEIDPASAPELERMIKELDPAGVTVVDMSSVTFCDSSELRVFVSQHQRHSESGGRLVLTNVSDAVARVFEITGLDELLFATEDAD